MRASLYSYLLQHKQLSLQGLGTIHVISIPAHLDIANKQLLPPGIQFRFDPYFDAPNHEFLRYIAANEQLTDAEALKWFNEWCFELRQEIKSASKVILNRVGTLSQDVSGDILLASVTPSSVFAMPVAAERILRHEQHRILVGESEWSLDEAQDNLNERKALRSLDWWPYAAILLGISMAAIIYYYLMLGSTNFSLGSIFGL